MKMSTNVQRMSQCHKESLSHKVKITPPLGTAELFPHKGKGSCGVQHLKKDLCPDGKFNSRKMFSGQQHCSFREG